MPVLIYEPVVARKVYRTQAMARGVERTFKTLMGECLRREGGTWQTSWKIRDCVCICPLQTYPGNVSAPTDSNVYDQAQS